MTHTFSFSSCSVTKKMMFHNNTYRGVRWIFTKNYIVIVLTLARITINKDYVSDKVKQKNLRKNMKYDEQINYVFLINFIHTLL